MADFSVPPVPSDATSLTQSPWPQGTLSSIGDAVITIDSRGLVTVLNPVAEYLTGWTQSAAVGVPLQDIFSLVNEVTRVPVESPTVKAFRESVVVELPAETLLITKDGTERPIDGVAATIRRNQSEVDGVVIVFRDISHRREAERALAKTLAYADDIIATLREPFLVVDRDLRIRTANKSFYDSFHVAKEETEHRLLYELGNGQWDIPALRTLLDQVGSRSEHVHDFEMEHEFPVLGRKTMLLNAQPFPRASQHPELILLAIEDITERREAAATIAGSEVRYRRLFEAAHDGILILNAETGRITDANPFMHDLLGYPPGAFISQELWEIGLFSDKVECEAAVRRLMDTGYIRYENLPLETKHGSKVEVEVVANVYSEGRESVIQCNIRDITERSRLEVKAHAQTEVLADLHRRKDEFLAMLSHELRNPLAPIANAVQLLRLHNNADSLQKQAHSIIERQVTQLTRLVDDLMEVSRITTGRIQLRLNQVALNGIVARAVETARPSIEERKHTLSIELCDETCWLNADAARLEQVVINLLTNAAKYTDEGGHIHLHTMQVGEECVLRVGDTGVGISPELLPRIFDLFTQAERSLDRSQGGLGIGLAIVQRLVELHGGRVEAHSSLGKGSEFVVRLPVMQAPESEVVVTQTGLTAGGVSLRVLVVDDNRDAAATLRMLLTELGHQVCTVYDGPTGLQGAIDFRPDAVLLDIGLPGLNGYEVARRLRQQPEFANVILIALTGYGQETDRHVSKEAGFDHHLVKPVDFNDVQVILASAAKTP